MKIENLNKILLVIFVSSLVSIPSLGQNIDLVKVIPGKGIIINDDSIKLYKTKVEELCKILKIKDHTNQNIIPMRIWDGFDPKTGESKSGTEYFKDLKYKSITFQFSDSADYKNLKLKWIQIKEDKSIKAYTDNGLVLGAINPKINQIYPETGQWDYFSRDSLTYNLYTYGISLGLVRLQNNDLKLIEISTHFRDK